MERCERSGKQIYSSKAEAGAARGKRHALPRINSYLCGDCGGWHLGHEPTKHWSRRRTRKKEGQDQMHQDELVVTSATEELATIHATLTSKRNALLEVFTKALAVLQVEADNEVAAIMNRLPTLERGS